MYQAVKPRTKRAPARRDGPAGHGRGVGAPWIRERLRKLQAQGKDKTQKGLADMLGIAKSKINEMIDGPRRITAADVIPIAQYLELSQLEVIMAIVGESLIPKAERQCYVRGFIADGVFRRPPRTGDGNMPQLSPMRPDPRFPDAEQVVFEVMDDSCEPTYPKGSYLLTVGLNELGRKPNPGDHLIIEARRGNCFEFTCQVGPWSSPPKGRKPVAVVVCAYIMR